MNNYVVESEAATLHIDTVAARSFGLTLDLKRALVGTYVLQVKTFGQAEILSFSIGNGITIQGTKLILSKTATAMAVATGVHYYDLVETVNDQSDSLLAGNFIIRPSTTTL